MKSHNLQQSVIMGNWDEIYAQNDADGMYTSFFRTKEKTINQNISRKKVFIRKEESNLLFQEKWVKAATKNLPPH